MIDVVLTLFHQGHQSPIYVISRHGLLPLTHALTKTEDRFLPQGMPNNLRALTKKLREMERQGCEWRSLMNAVRRRVPDLWIKMKLADKKQFIRHLLPYWNIHRHRVPASVDSILKSLLKKNQLHVLAGRVLFAQDGVIHVQMRGTQEVRRIEFDWLINCSGPSLDSQSMAPGLVRHLLSQGLVIQDPLKLGFVTASSGGVMGLDGKVSDQIYTLGPPVKGMRWECSSVPEIRSMAKNIAINLLKES
jgi:uncharacterized NAD(P)/FAD-binding protein YdhS